VRDLGWSQLSASSQYEAGPQYKIVRPESDRCLSAPIIHGPNDNFKIRDPTGRTPSRVSLLSANAAKRYRSFCWNPCILSGTSIDENILKGHGAMSPSDQEKASLLPAKTYDEDAPTIDPASGNESDDGLSTVDGRPSIEVAQRDLEVLEEDYESDHGPGSESTSTRRGIIARIFRRAEDNKYEEPMHQRKKQPSRRHRERLRRGEESAEMMYEMEEGGEASQTPSRNSSEVDLLRLEKVQRGKYVRCPHVEMRL
jgi:hypothetical protein